MNLAQEKASAANVFGIMSGCVNFRPVYFRTTPSEPMIEVMSISRAWSVRGRYRISERDLPSKSFD